VEGDTVAASVRELLKDREGWSGTMTELLDVLATIAGDRMAGSRSFPANSRVLSNRLRRVRGPLQKVGIEMEYIKGRTVRTIRLWKADSLAILASRASRASQPNEFNDLRATQEIALASRVTQESLPVTQESSSNPFLRPPFIAPKSLDSLENGIPRDERDASDARISRESAGESKGIVWTRKDWLAFYDNEAQTAEWDNGETHEIAAATAFETCVTEYRNQYPSTSRNDARDAIGGMLG